MSEGDALKFVKDLHPEIECHDPENGDDLIEGLLAEELELEEFERFIEHLRSPCHACAIQVVNLTTFVDWLKETYEHGIN